MYTFLPTLRKSEKKKKVHEILIRYTVCCLTDLTHVCITPNKSFRPLDRFSVGSIQWC